MKNILLSVLILLTIQTAFAQQTAGVSVQGVVAQRGTTEVVWGANVELRKEGTTMALYGAVTGNDGKFAFPSVAPGRYHLTATAQGHVPAEYGQKRMKGAGLPLAVEVGRPMSGVRIEMT